jgi:hypothetical protein
MKGDFIEDDAVFPAKESCAGTMPFFSIGFWRDLVNARE